MGKSCLGGRVCGVLEGCDGGGHGRVAAELADEVDVGGADGNVRGVEY